MKKRVLMVMVLALALSVPAFAGSMDSAVEVFSSLTGMTVEEAWELRHDTDQTFGELAIEKGVGDEFSDQIQELNKARIEDLVDQGRLTQKQADEILKAMEDCDGTPGSHMRLRDVIGSGNGLGNGSGPRNGEGLQNGEGLRRGGGNPNGFGGGRGFRGGSES